MTFIKNLTKTNSTDLQSFHQDQRLIVLANTYLITLDLMERHEMNMLIAKTEHERITAKRHANHFGFQLHKLEDQIDGHCRVKGYQRHVVLWYKNQTITIQRSESQIIIKRI